jgi:hypothetical protein
MQIQLTMEVDRRNPMLCRFTSTRTLYVGTKKITNSCDANGWVTFAYEQGYYRTRAANRSGVTLLPLFRGVPSFTTHNIRSEFAAIFSF